MTNEESIQILNSMKKYVLPDMHRAEALNMAIKALGQKPKADVLDEIMAEINTPNRGTCDYFIVDRIEEIIYKYRQER